VEDWEHVLGCKRCAYWTEVARQFDGTRLGPRERFLLQLMASADHPTWKPLPGLDSADRNSVARLRKHKLVYKEKCVPSTVPTNLRGRWRWRAATIGEVDALSKQSRELYEFFEGIVLNLVGVKKSAIFRIYWRTPLGDALISLYETQLKSDVPILSDWDVGALATEIVNNCTDRQA
jgi:hypothetical protein